MPRNRPEAAAGALAGQGRYPRTKIPAKRTGDRGKPKPTKRGKRTMAIWDEKDVQIIAQAINSVAPEATDQRADLILHAAWVAGVKPDDMEEAIARF